MLTVTLNDFASAGPDASARLTALLPVMEERYQRLRGTLTRALDGEDIPDWELDLHRADLLAALDAMAPGPVFEELEVLSFEDEGEAA